MTDSPDSDSGADWSPDGARLAFHSRRTGNNEIFVMDIDGLGLTQVTDDPDHDSQGATWQPR